MSNIDIMYVTNDTVLTTDFSHYAADSTSNSVTLTMLQINGEDGIKFTINKVAGSNTVTISPDSNDSINVGSITLSANETASLVSYGGVWYRF